MKIRQKDPLERNDEKLISQEVHHHERSGYVVITVPGEANTSRFQSIQADVLQALTNPIDVYR